MRSIPSWLILGVLAFLVGTLFRLGELTGAGLFRMFGYLGMAVTAIIATWMLTRSQERSGRDELRRALESRDTLRLYRVPEGLHVPWLTAEVIVECNGVYYLITSTTLPNFRGRRYRRRLRSAIEHLSKVGTRDDDFPLRHVIVLLRRRVRDEEQRLAEEYGVTLVNPEGLAGLWASRSTPPPGVTDRRSLMEATS